MIHKTIKATTTATDQGVFTALAATFDVDRVNDQIVPGAFAKTIAAWRSSEKFLPVHWDHSGQAADVIGSIDPAKMEETKDGLYVEGKLDLEDSEVAKEAWRSMKNNAVSLSFGYLAVSESKRADGVNELTELDLFEVSIVPAPANIGTRFLSLKNANGQVETEEQDTDEEPELEELAVEDGSDEELAQAKSDEDEEPEPAKSAPQDPLRKRSLEAVLEIASAGVKARRHIEPEPPEPLDERELKRRSRELLLELASGE